MLACCVFKIMIYVYVLVWIVSSWFTVFGTNLWWSCMIMDSNFLRWNIYIYIYYYRTIYKSELEKEDYKCGQTFYFIFSIAVFFHWRPRLQEFLTAILKSMSPSGTGSLHRRFHTSESWQNLHLEQSKNKIKNTR